MATALQEKAQLDFIPLESLQESATNPRKDFSDLSELVASIKMHGVITPLLAVPAAIPGSVIGKKQVFQIIAGTRRFRAAKEAGLHSVPVRIIAVDSQNAEELQIIENLQRRDIHPLEESAAYRRIATEYDLTIEQVADRVGKRSSYISQRMKLGDLIEPIRKMFAANKIGLGHALLVARLQPDDQKATVQSLQRGDSVVYLRGEIERALHIPLVKLAPFDIDDANLLPKAGSCMSCPKRTGANKALFEDIKQDDICTDPACFEAKCNAFVKLALKNDPKLLRLTVCSEYQKKEAKGETEWILAGDKECSDMKKGVVIERLVHYEIPGRTANVGAIVTVCTNPKCKTHGEYSSRYEGSSGGGLSKEQREKMKARKIELHRRGLTFKAIAETLPAPTKEYLRMVLDWRIKSLSHDTAKAICDALGWSSEKKDSESYQDVVEKQLRPVKTLEELQTQNLLLSVAEIDLWFYSGHTPKPNLLERIARDQKVDLSGIAKLAKEKLSKAKTGKKKGEQMASKEKKKKKVGKKKTKPNTSTTSPAQTTAQSESAGKEEATQ